MKISVLLVIAFIAGAMTAGAETYFADSFDRADTSDIDASYTGMSGLAAPITYRETDGSVGIDSLTRIAGSTLHMADGPNASVVGLASHSFTNSSILAEGGFSISMNIANAGTSVDNNRWCGFGIGLSAAEMAALDLDFSGNHGPRGTYDGSNAGVADFFVEWSPTGGGGIHFFTAESTGGTSYAVSDPDGGLLQVDFYFNSFTAGQTVHAVVYFEGVQIIQTDFTWSGSPGNYIALSARQNESGMRVDDLQIASPIHAPEKPLFADSFNRSAALDADAGTNGMSGLFAPIIYQEVEVSPEMTQVTNDALYMAFGPNASVVGLSMLNFTNAIILSNGGFSVSMDITDLGNGTASDHFCGFGVGLAAGELAALDLDFSSVNGPRGTFSGSNSGVADCFVDWTPNGSGGVQLFSSATSGGTQVPVNAASGGRLHADFFLNSFAAGAPVQTAVYFNGALVASDTFEWSASNANYIALSTRQVNGIAIDNLLIDKPLYEPAVIDYSDSFQVLKNSSSNVLDVLKNDVGTGLSLLSISSPSNGTAYVSGNTAVYTPDIGHSGLDGFSYTTVDNAAKTNVWSVTVDTREYPNFVLIYTDDQGWTSLSALTDTNRPNSKSDYHITPNIAKLAAEGMRFSRAYSPAPNCSPSRYAVQTGKTCTHLGFTDITGRNNNPTPNSSYRLISPGKKVAEIQTAETTIAEQLKSIAGAGYVAGHFGKWHMNGGGPGNHGYDAHDGNTANAEGSSGPSNVAVADPKLVYSMTGRSTGWMENTVGNREPFYLQVAHYAVHRTVQFSQAAYDVYDGVPPGTHHNSRNYAAMITDMDNGVGLLLDKIDELGIRNSTYIIYQADNGAPAALSDNTPLRGYKPEQWEGGTRVPTFVRGPGVAQNSQCDVPVMGIDIMPTIWEWATGSSAGLPVNVDGGSWVETINQVSEGQPTRSMIDRSGEMVIYAPHYVVNSDPKDQRPRAVIHAGDYKLVVQFEQGTIELYNLEERIEEDNDIAAIEVGIKWQLWLRLRDYMKSHGALYALPDADNWPGSDGIQDDDVDNDGLPDEWEARELLTFALDGSDDSDRDGISNAEEQAAGSDPLIPESISIDPQFMSTNNTLRLSWTSVPGDRFAVETSTNLMDWVTDQTANAGNTFDLGVDLELDKDHSFYRVIKL